MLMCYVDESGDTGLFDANERNSQPVFLLCALMVNQSRLESITREVIHLKQSHFPSYSQGIQHWHDWLKVEVKDANIRRALREDTRKSRRHILGFLSAIVTLLESNDARISARVYIKEPACEFKGASVYSAAMQRLAQTFEDKLIRENESGQYADTCVHASHDYDVIRETFGQRIKALQYRYERDGHKLGGIHVLGGNCRLNPILIFGDKA